MKLVDILARELKAWPCLGRKLCQGHKGHIYPTDGGDTYAITDRADDWELADVTRDEWQAAVDVLKAETAPAWVGIGLPPVGTDCAYNIGDGWYECLVKYILNRPGEQSYSLVAWCYHLDKDQYLSLDKGCKFRPIRTPEQIAAEERSAGIAAILYAYTYTVGPCTHKLSHSQAERLYDAGVRKVTP